MSSPEEDVISVLSREPELQPNSHRRRQTQKGADCQRRVLSCARCRKRKIKCDRKLPACSQCTAADTRCTGFNSADENVEIPRSIVQYLEFLIAQAEIETAVQNGRPKDKSDETIEIVVPKASDGLNRLSEAAAILQMRARGFQDDLEESIVRSFELRAMIGATIPMDPSLTDLVSQVRMGLTPSLLLNHLDKGEKSRRTPATISTNEGHVECSTLASLPTHVIHSLVRKYMRYVLPRAPVMLQTDITKQLDVVLARMYGDGCENPPQQVERSFSFLVIYVILAIASTLGCAKSRHESRCIAFSEILFREGIPHLSAESPFYNDLAGIQTTLLILQYAEINPKCANIWILSGTAMRSCLELGLHREPVRSVQLDPSAIDSRRRVFWMAYCMDRTVSSALQKPLSIPDSDINTLYPEILEPNLSSNNRLDGPSQPSKQLALQFIQYCRIQSELTEVHFHGKPLGQDWEEWLADMERQLKNWYEQYSSPEEESEIAYTHALVRLHRPSPRSLMPSSQSLVVAFNAACKSAKSYRESILGGLLRRPWLAAHHSAETAMVAIFCLRHAFDQISGQYSLSDIFDLTKTFTTNLISLSGQGWTEASELAATYELLLAPLVGAVLSRKTSDTLAYPPELDEQLTKFLFPGPTNVEEFNFSNGLLTDFPDGTAHYDGSIPNWDILEGFGSTTDVISWDAMTFDDQITSPTFVNML